MPATGPNHEIKYGEIAGRPFDDVVEVSNYVDAMMHRLARLPDLPPIRR